MQTPNSVSLNPLKHYCTFFCGIIYCLSVQSLCLWSVESIISSLGKGKRIVADNMYCFFYLEMALYMRRGNLSLTLAVWSENRTHYSNTFYFYIHAQWFLFSYPMVENSTSTKYGLILAVPFSCISLFPSKNSQYTCLTVQLSFYW